jgi:hypothetical protein
MTGAPESNPGLCAGCRHARRLASDRGSVFWQCQLSFTDPRFPKYPRLPVRDCLGYQRKDPATSLDASDSSKP